MLLKYLPGQLICKNSEIKNSTDTMQPEPEEYIDESEKSETGHMQQLKKLEGLDVKTGLAYCMNEEEFYVEMLKEYLKADKAPKIEKFFAEEDWDNYRTVVHALKSTSLTIGAVHLSEAAKALEMAAKEGNADYIRSHHKDAMEEYATLKNGISKIEGGNTYEL